MPKWKKGHTTPHVCDPITNPQRNIHPSCGQSLCFSCGAAEGVTKECTLRVLLLTSPGQMEQKIPFLEHVNSFAINRFSPRIKLESI